MKPPSEPTSEQCSANARLGEDENYVDFACWYPQMGGDVGKAVVRICPAATENTCFDVWVWHDGEFPFGASSDPGRPAYELHHCDAEQFIEFVTTVLRLQHRTGEEPSDA